METTIECYYIDSQKSCDVSYDLKPQPSTFDGLLRKTKMKKVEIPYIVYLDCISLPMILVNCYKLDKY